MGWTRAGFLSGLLSCGVTVMSNGQETKTLDEWKKEKDTAEAQAAALEARRKLVEARTALASAEAAATRQGGRQLQEQIAAAKAAKEVAEARKAASEAELAAFKASLGEVPASGHSGTVDLKADAGKVEAALLAAKAVGTAAQKIRTTIGPPANPKASVVTIYSAALLPRFDLWATFRVQTGLAQKAFENAQAMTDTLEGRGLEMVPLPAAAGLTLEAINNLLGFFRTDYTIGGIELTLDDALLVDAVAGALRAQGWTVRIPGRYDTGMVAAAQDILDTLSTLSQSNARGREARAQHEKTAADMTEAAARATDAAKKTQLEEEGKRHKEAAAAWQGAMALYEAFYGTLATAGDKGLAPLTALVRERSVTRALEAGGKLLVVQLHNSGGAYYTKKNLWSLFGGMPLYHMGGTVAAFALFDGVSGEVGAAGIIPVHGGFVRAGKLEAEMK